MAKVYIEKEATINAVTKDMGPHRTHDFNAGCARAVNRIVNVPAADVVEVVRCKDCIHRASGTGVNHDVKFPDDECPCKCPDTWYSWMPPDEWYCASGKRKYGGPDDD